MKLLPFLCLLSLNVTCQTLPSSRMCNWKLAGLRDTSTFLFTDVYASDLGFVGDGLTSNDAIWANISFNSNGTRIHFDSGVYLFNSSISIPSNVLLKGSSAALTTFRFDQGGTGHSIQFLGSESSSISPINQTLEINQTAMYLNGTSLESSDYFRLGFNDSSFVTSDWALGTVGQVIRVASVSNDTVYFESPIRLTYPISKNPWIQQLNVVSNSGLECLTIERIDNTSPEQACVIYLENSANCWVQSVQTKKCTFAHVGIAQSTNILLNQCYFQDAFEFGGNGRAYGVVCHLTTNECLIQNSIFRKLRHSMLLQAGANCNVFAYNYSLEPFWDSTPSDAAGDFVLHGNFPYLNLFEQNVGRNAIIDNSHGMNGMYNTFFRNRLDGYGIFFSSSNSPSQNFLGNTITNTSFPYSLGNYVLQGADHFVFGNNNKGTITPLGTNALPEQSLYYDISPDFCNAGQFGGVGVPNPLLTGTVSAQTRFNSAEKVPCDVISYLSIKEEKGSITFVNPTSKELTFTNEIDEYAVYSTDGKVLQTEIKKACTFSFDLLSGFYLIKFRKDALWYEQHLLIQ